MPKICMSPYITEKMSGFHLAVHRHSFNVFPTHIYNSPVFKIEWVLITTLNYQGQARSQQEANRGTYLGKNFEKNPRKNEISHQFNTTVLTVIYSENTIFIMLFTSPRDMQLILMTGRSRNESNTYAGDRK